MIGVVGSGAWGSALAASAAKAGHAVTLWGRTMPSPLAGVRTTTQLSDVETAAAILLAVPAQTLRPVARQLRPHVANQCPLIICAKGIELESGKLLAALLAEELPDHSLAILSGPTFASEVSAGRPTAATLACRDADVAASLCDLLSSASFRLYHSCDIIGVEIGGALKNVIAIACGIVMGRGLGENARAALMARGLAEMTRLGVKLGAQAETFMGLSGLGDLALTCHSRQSRNFSLGERIGHGETAAIAAHGHLVEGVATASAVMTLAKAHNVEMPIAAAVQAILSGSASIDEAILALLKRPLKTEGFL